MRRVLLAFVAVALMGGSACGAPSHDTAANPPTSAVDTNATLRRGPSSSVFEIPVPAEATLDAFGYRAGESEVWHTPVGYAESDLGAFYESRLAGHAVGGYRWCGERGSFDDDDSGNMVEMLWWKEGTDRYLSVILVREPLHKHGPGIIISEADDIDTGCSFN